MTGNRHEAELEELRREVLTLQEELDQTNKGTIALTMELEESQEALRKRAAELRRSNAELAAVNEELSDFAFSVSHDLKAPLRAVLGFSGMLAEEYSQSLDEDGAQLVERVQRAAARMSELIEDLLQLSRAARMDMEVEDIDLTGIVEDVAAGLRSLEPERHVEILVEEGMRCRGDARLFRNVMENLLGNAWKFTARREHGRIDVGVDKDSWQSVYYVKDNGAGFDMAYAQKLFVPFQRLHTDTEFPGTGVGLATVRRILRRHGGDIWAESQVGEGAKFSFTVAIHADA